MHAPRRPGRRRWVVAVDLGTGGPKVGLVSLTGELAWHEHQAVPTVVGDDGEATQDAGLWWDLVCDAVRRAVGSGAVPTEGIVAVSCTGQWASTVPVDGGGLPVGPCQLWSDTRGGPHARDVVGGPVAGLRTRGRAALDPPQRRRTVDVGGRPDRPHAPPRARRARDRPGGPLVPRAGRLPVDALHGEGLGHAGLDGRGVAHRQPGRRSARIRPGPGRRVRRPGGQTAATRADGRDRGHRAATRWRPTSGCPTGWS